MFNLLQKTHLSWHTILKNALSAMDDFYLTKLMSMNDWLPGSDAIFNAFSKPLKSTHYIMFGESPYPRAVSANGYAFWDNAVTTIWSDAGLSKAVNRATSLRNFIKMLLVARGDLTTAHVNQIHITKINKDHLIKQLSELFENLLNHGFLLLNASLVLTSHPVKYDAKFWLPFIQSVLRDLACMHQPIQLILLGNIAKTIGQVPEAKQFPQFVAEHPYNISFIYNSTVRDFFRPFDLLKR